MPKQHTVTDLIQTAAISHFFALIDAQGNLATVLPKVNAWLSEEPAHHVAWEHLQCTCRLMRPFFKAAEPGASDQDIAAFIQALEHERRRATTGFVDALAPI